MNAKENTEPYTKENFPVTTDKPKIDVSLPVGTHVLELIVEDSAGMKSAPSYVTITVVKEKEVTEPQITGISPNSGQPGDKIEAEITGENLQDATAVTFSGEKIKADILQGSTAKSLKIHIEIDPEAVPGPRQFTVVTPVDEAQSTKDVCFTVEEATPEPDHKTILKEASKKAEQAKKTIQEVYSAFEGIVNFENLSKGAPFSLDIANDLMKMAMHTRRSLIKSANAISEAEKAAELAGSDQAIVLRNAGKQFDTVSDKLNEIEINLAGYIQKSKHKVDTELIKTNTDLIKIKIKDVEELVSAAAENLAKEAK